MGAHKAPLTSSSPTFLSFPLAEPSRTKLLTFNIHRFSLREGGVWSGQTSFEPFGVPPPPKSIALIATAEPAAWFGLNQRSVAPLCVYVNRMQRNQVTNVNVRKCVVHTYTLTKKALFWRVVYSESAAGSTDSLWLGPIPLFLSSPFPIDISSKQHSSTSFVPCPCSPWLNPASPRSYSSQYIGYP